MDRKNVAILMVTRKVFDIISINGGMVKVKNPDRNFTLVDIDDPDFIMLFNVTEKQIDTMVKSI